MCISKSVKIISKWIALQLLLVAVNLHLNGFILLLVNKTHSKLISLFSSTHAHKLNIASNDK